MFKFLIPSLFLSTVAFADAPKVPSTNEPVEHTLNLNPGKCSTDIKNTIDSLKESGYRTFVEFKDIVKTNVVREILYDFHHDHMAVISIINGENNTPIKLCLEYVGEKPYGIGPVFKDFLLHQEINDMNTEQDAEEAAKKKHLEEEHDPYQGDPSKI
jgi:hypothetical protein